VFVACVSRAPVLGVAVSISRLTKGGVFDLDLDHGITLVARRFEHSGPRHRLLTFVA
jgi:hypothetical protein